MSIKYEVVANNLKEGTYYPRVLPGDRVDLETMIGEIVGETSLSDSDIRAVISSLVRRVRNHLSEGRRPAIDGLAAFSVELAGIVAQCQYHPFFGGASTG